jgi:hypothetical protein
MLLYPLISASSGTRLASVSTWIFRGEEAGLSNGESLS